MAKLQKYILKNFFNVFVNIFFILFLITSIIIIISISNATASIYITFFELIKMYFLSLTKILIITLSISFFITSVLTYTNLSESQELISFFSTGITPKRLLKPVFIMAFLTTLINFFILFVSIPYSDLVYHNFKNQKKAEAKFNIQTSQISQKFGDWNVFIENKNKDYENIYLFNPTKNEFITAQKAKLFTKNNFLTFKLQKGDIYNFDKNLSIHYKITNINQHIPYINFSILEYKKYLKKHKKLLLFYFTFALIPIALFFYIPFLGFFHPRLHKNNALLYSIIVLTIYSVTTKISSPVISFIMILLFFLSGLILYLKDKRF